MIIDFQPVLERRQTLYELACGFGGDLRLVFNHYTDTTLRIVEQLDEQALFAIPEDPEADDPYASSAEERHAGWSIAHLVLHVAASAEEGAALSSLLARGICVGGRLRHEPDWRLFTTRAQLVARLEECRGICLAYVAAWPNQPDLQLLQPLPEHLGPRKINAPAAALGGLLHWHVHVPQLYKLAQQLMGPELMVSR